ncbi:Lipoprotein LpqB, beta-propeller domain-like protein [Cellulomonas flavigena DSM 20109]|uniref:Lipoprotein LpqB, beta-propeller domain-like protein n=1 Tax=Cellulomonas flavigena (strain ATCC 482 / DSM 20109 / BCRC 11376 / JCM 18109 / NBRC 3775 / NCIMB 8073 / NRS 134) TaxID=446466 RepID=D5UGX2_CELFN|nr:LpqB family beta-propeller domain-containing protein [Cellulomonas flavigena]ADG75220.1 Lipoprotein LpqB, beta-propeller domain-like protein [Cellulomonas flavigena DSM 20109]
MRRVRAATCLAALLTALTACVAIPTDGPVTEGRADAGLDGDQDVVVVLAQGPEPGADPERIVEGFLLASDAEVTGEFEKTRQFLAADASTEWDPGAGTVVTSRFEVEQTGDAQVTVELTVSAKVDADGRYLETPSDAVETLRYELVQNARGEWRIAYAPDVLVVTARRFVQQFRPAYLYFLTPDEKLLVPEVRWFRDRNVPTAAVRALLAGPSPWLQDAVVTAVPPGTELKPAAVALEGKVAEMTLEPAAAVQDADRGLLLAQLRATLERLGVDKLVVRAGGAPLGGAATALAAPDPGELELLVDGQALRLVGGSAVPVDGVGAVVGSRPHSAARTADGGVRVALADASTLVAVPVGDAEQRTLLTGPALAAPSADRYAWVWTARGDAAGRLDAVRLDGTAVEVTADWLVGRTVEAVRVSRDGTRVAVVSRGAEGATLEVAGVTRDERGVPLTLGAAVRAGASLTPTRSLVWVDDVTLGVLADGDAGPTPYLVPVAGSSTPLPAVADVVDIAADRGTRSLYVVTADGDVLRHEGGTWVAVPGVTDVLEVAGAAFPG